MEKNKYTQKSIEAIKDAQNTAIKNGNPEVSELHLHLALISDGEGVIQSVLKKMGVDINPYLEDVASKINQLPSTSGSGNIYPSTVFQRVLLKSEDEAKAMGDSYVSVEHLYMALLKEKNNKRKKKSGYRQSGRKR